VSRVDQVTTIDKLMAALAARNERELFLLNQPKPTLADTVTDPAWLDLEVEEEYAIAEDGSNIIFDLSEDNKLLGLVE